MPYIGRELDSGNYLQLDDISSQFNGSLTRFNLTNGGLAFFPGSAFSIIVTLNGLVQTAGIDFTIDSSEIVFTSAPANGVKFACLVLGEALAVGSNADGTVSGVKLTKPFTYDSYFQLDSSNDRVGIGTLTPGFLLEVGNTGSAGTSVYIHGDTRVTGILSVGQGTITLDPNQDMIKLGELTLSRNSNGHAQMMTTGGGYAPFRANEYLVGVTTVIDSNRNFIGVNANFSGIVTFSSGFGADVSFADNVKAKFGAGDDLQIYHDTNNSYIKDNGTGSLRILGGNTTIMNAAESKTSAIFNTASSVDLYYDNSLKFHTTGIGISVSNGAASTATISGPSNIVIDPGVVGDNTGLVRIKGDLFVDGTTTQINSTSLEIADFIVGIASTATTDLLSDGAGIKIGPDNTFLYEHNSGTNPSLKSSENLNVASGKVYQIAETERLSADTLSVGTGATVHSPASNTLTLGTAGTETLRIDSDGDVGIGIADPKTKLHVARVIMATGATPQIRLNANDSDLSDDDRSMLGQATGNGHFVNTAVDNDTILRGTATGNLLFGVGTAEKVRIKSNGNFGIGSPDPDKKLVVLGADTEVVIDDTNGSPVLRLRNNGTTGGTFELTSSNDLLFRAGGTAEQLRITSDGNVGIGTDDPGQLLHLQSNANQTSLILQNVGAGGTSWYLQSSAASASNGQGNFSVYNSTTTNYAFSIKGSNDNIGIGTTNPSAKLHVSGGDLYVNSLDGSEVDIKLGIHATDSNFGIIKNVRASNSQNYLSFNIHQSGTLYEALQIHYDEGFYIRGNKEYNTTAYTGKSANVFFGDQERTFAEIVAESESTSSALGALIFKTKGSVGAFPREKVRITSDGKVGIGSDDPSELLHLESGHTKQILKSTNTNTASSLIFDTGNINTADFLLGQLAGKWNGNDVAYIQFEAGADTTNKDDGVITFLTSSASSTPAERLRITSGGNVQVNGGNVHIDDNGEFAIFEEDTSLAMTNSSKISMDFASNVARIRSSHNGSAVSRPLAFFIGSSEKLRINSNGKVGIGKTNPETNLDVSAVGAGVSISATGSFTGATLTLEGHRNAGNITNRIGEINFINRRNAAETNINVTGDGDLYGTYNGTQLFRVLSDGKVGIGITNPGALLHISSGTSGDATLILEADTDNNNEADNPNIIFRQDGSKDLGAIGMNLTNSSSVAPSNELYVAASTADAAIVLATGTSNGYTNATERLRIDSSGRIGIDYTPSSGDGIFNVKVDGTHVLHIGHGTNNDNYFTCGASGIQVFRAAGTERLRIESNGNIKATSATQYKGFHLVKADGGTVAQLVGHGSDNDEGGLNLWDGGVKKVQILANGFSYLNGGKVGIGTAAATNPLHIYTGSSEATPLMLQRAHTNNVVVAYQNDTSSMFAGMVGNASGWGVSNQENLAGNPMFMVERTTGDIGIATIDPVTKLDVNQTTQFDITSATASAGIFVRGGDTAGQNNYGGAITLSKIASTRPGGSIAAVQTTADPDQMGIAFFTHGQTTSNNNVTERLRIDSAGRLLLGTTTEGETTADNLTIADSGHCGVTIRSGTSSEGNIFFSDGTSGDSEYRGMVRYEHSNDAMVFKTATAERLRIGSSGQIGLGGANYGSSGQVLTSNGSSSAPTWQDSAGGFDGGTVTGITTFQGSFIRMSPGGGDTGALKFGTGNNYQILAQSSTLELAVAAGKSIKLNQGNSVYLTTTDGGIDLTGITTVSQSTSGTPTLTIKNTGGAGSGTGTGAQIAKFVGDSDGILIQNIAGGDYGIYNIAQDNGFELYDGTGGVRILYNGNIGVEFDSGNTYGDFKGVPTVNGTNLARTTDNITGTSGGFTAGDASNLDSGTVPDARFPATLPAVSGANLTNVDAATLDGIDSANFLRSNAADSFSGALTGSGTISVTGTKIECGRTSGSVAMTTNDGYGNANLCFNHTSGVPDVNGSSCRIETSVDNNTGFMLFEVGNSVTANNAVTLTEVLKLTTSAVTAQSGITFTGDGSGLTDIDDLASTVNNVTQTADNQQDITFFGASGGSGAAQSGNFSSRILLKGGGSQTRCLILGQDYNGYATIDTSWTDNYLDITSNFERVRFNQQGYLGTTQLWDDSGNIQNLGGLASTQFIRSDANTNVSAHTEWQDNQEVRLGNAADFRMYFNGADTVFRNYAHANGDIVFQGETSGGTNQNIMLLKTDSTATYVNLRYNNNTRMETSDAGVDVTGIIKAEGIQIDRPSDLWATEYIDVGGVGALYTHGSYRTTLISNGYRTSGGVWESRAINSATGAASIELDPTGYLLFNCETSKADGATTVITNRFTVTEDGINLATGSRINNNNDDSYDKLRVWNSSAYTIGMKSAQTHGRLNDYAMTFTMNNDADRGWNWRHSSADAATSAMSLSTDGGLAVSRGINVGGGVGDTAWSDYPLHIDNSWQTSMNASQYATYVDFDLAGTGAFSANRTNAGMRVDVDTGVSNTTNTAGDRHSVYGIHCTNDTTEHVYLQTGVYGYCKSTASDSLNANLYGVYGYAQNYKASGPATCVGGYFLGYGGGSTTGGALYGVRARAHLTTNGSGKTITSAYGCHAEVECDEDTITNAYGVFSHIDRDAGTITTGYLYYGSFAGTVGTKRGIWLTNSDESSINGNLTCSGNVTAYSDIKLKENVETLENSLDKVCKLRGVSFNRKDLLGKPKQIGVIAQEIEKVVPEVVSESPKLDEEGKETGEFTKGVSYGNLTALLIEAVKEQQETIKKQQEQIDELRELITKRDAT